MTLKLVFTASLLDVQHRNSVKNKPASLFVSLGKALSRIPPSWCGKQIAGNSGSGFTASLLDAQH